VARSEALVRSAQDLERENAADRSKVTALRSQIAGLETQAASRSDAARRMQQEVADLRQHAGLTALRGPGVGVDLADGQAGPDLAGRTAYRVNFEDIQDVVNVLFSAGAEGVAVNGRRITPASSFAGSGSAVVIDQGPPLSSPYHLLAVGNRTLMEQVLADPATLGDLRNRAHQYGLRIAYAGSPDLTLPAADALITPRYASPT
jgi:uncharacterized protein YlxW (UPF0749 family)